MIKKIRFLKCPKAFNLIFMYCDIYIYIGAKMLGGHVDSDNNI